MSEPTTWPHFEKSGNVSVPIYKTTTGRGYTEFKVVWRDGERKRRFKTFADFDKARAHARSVTASIGKGDVHALSLTADDRLIYLRAIGHLAGLETPLDVAAHQFAEAKRMLGEVPLKEAAAYWLKHNAGITRKTVREVVNEMIEAKRNPANKKRPASGVYLKDLEGRLGKFADAFHIPLADLTPGLIEEFLNGLNLTERTWFNYARLIRTLMRYGQRKNYFSRNIEPMGEIEIKYEDDEEISIFTPAELAKLLSTARPEIVPFLAIAAFAGLRTAEIERLDWSEIGKDYVKVPAKKTKTRSARLVPILPALQKWLQPHRKESGPVTPFANMSKQVLRLADEAGVKWKHNALRHSFISYRMGITNNENLVAAEAGNSPAMINKHYRNPDAKPQAEAWFSIEPKQPANLLQMAAA